MLVVMMIIIVAEDKGRETRKDKIKAPYNLRDKGHCKREPAIARCQKETFPKGILFFTGDRHLGGGWLCIRSCWCLWLYVCRYVSVCFFWVSRRTDGQEKRGVKITFLHREPISTAIFKRSFVPSLLRLGFLSLLRITCAYIVRICRYTSMYIYTFIDKERLDLADALH